MPARGKATPAGTASQVSVNIPGFILDEKKEEEKEEPCGNANQIRAQEALKARKKRRRMPTLHDLGRAMHLPVGEEVVDEKEDACHDKARRHGEITSIRQVVDKEGKVHEAPRLLSHQFNSAEREEGGVDVYHEPGTEYKYFGIWDFKLHKFDDYGVGIRLYFELLKWFMIMFCVLFVLSLPVMLVYYINGKNGNYVKRTFMGSLAECEVVGGVEQCALFGMTRQQHATFSVATDMVCCVVFVCACLWLFRRVDYIVREYTYEQVLISDYTVQVRGLDKSFRDRIALAEFFEQAVGGEVSELVLTMDNQHQLEQFAERGRLADEIVAAEEYDHGVTGSVHLALLKKKKTQLDHFIANAHDAVHCTSAFVTFEHVHSKAKCLRLSGAQLKYNDMALLVNHPSEPSNVHLENLRFTKKDIRKRRTCTLVLTFVIVCFTAVVGLTKNVLKNRVPSFDHCSDVNTNTTLNQDCICLALGFQEAPKDPGCSSFVLNFINAQLLSASTVVAVVAINFCVDIVVRKLGKWERHYSLSEEVLGNALSMFIAKALNTGFVLLVVFSAKLEIMGLGNVFTGEYPDFSEGWFDVVGYATFITVAAHLVVPHGVDVATIPAMAMQRFCCKPNHQAQVDLNEFYEGMEFEVSERFAMLLVVSYVVMFYSSGMPLLLLVGAMIYFATYWFDKTTFLRIAKIPPRYDEQLGMWVLHMMIGSVHLKLLCSVWTHTSALIYPEGFDSIFDRGFNMHTYPQWILLGVVLLCQMVVVFGGHTVQDKLKKFRIYVPDIQDLGFTIAEHEHSLESYFPEDNPRYAEAYAVHEDQAEELKYTPSLKEIRREERGAKRGTKAYQREQDMRQVAARKKRMAR